MTTVRHLAGASQPLDSPKARETVTLGLGSQFALSEPGERPSPRGLLPTPAAVLERLAAGGERFAAVSERKRRLVCDDWSLSYYFGGQEVAYRFTDAGVEVLAVGRPEIEAVRAGLPPAEHLGLIVEEIRPW